MKRMSAWACAAVVLVGIVGCGGGGPVSAQNAPPTADGRPAGFEDMMKEMGDQMTKGATPGAKPGAKPPRGSAMDPASAR